MREMDGKRIAELEAENARLRESLATRDAQWRDAIIPGNDDTLSRRFVTTPEGAALFTRAGRELVQEDAKFTEKVVHDRDRYKRKLDELMAIVKRQEEERRNWMEHYAQQSKTLQARLASAEAEREREKQAHNETFTNFQLLQAQASRVLELIEAGQEVPEHTRNLLRLAANGEMRKAPEQGT